MIETTDGVKLYTQDDYNAIASQQYQLGLDHAKDSVTNRLRSHAVDWFKGEVQEGSMTKEDALGIYNGLAGALGWEVLNSINSTYTVTVNYNGNTIAEFSGIEAEDTDSAEAEVFDNLEVEDVEINFMLSYNGETCRESVNATYEFDSADLEIEATED